jgi:hypothetical protein
MSVFVVNCETNEGTTVVGVFLNEKLAKAGAKDYAEEFYADSMKKKQFKKEDERKVLYKEKDDNGASLTLQEVKCELPSVTKTKAKKDKNAPKKPLSAYMIYAVENRERVKKENDGIAFGEIGKLLGNEWKQLNEKDKEKYIKKADEDKKRYETEFDTYSQNATVA